MRLPARSASTSSSRCIVVAERGPPAGSASGGGAASAPKALATNRTRRLRIVIPAPDKGIRGQAPSGIQAIGPRSLLPPGGAEDDLARADTSQVGRRVVAGAALDRLVDLALLVPQAHGNVAAGLQVVVHLER